MDLCEVPPQPVGKIVDFEMRNQAMKTGRIVWHAAALVGGVCDGQQAQTTQAAGDGDFSIVSRGPHGRTWKNSDGQRVEEIADRLQMGTRKSVAPKLHAWRIANE
jgi:hypothetical protein